MKKMRVKADYKIEHITDAEYHNNLKNNILKLLMDLKKIIQEGFWKIQEQ